MGNLLYLIAVVLIILWILGAFVSPFGGNLIHILLVIAIIAVLLRVIRGAA
ncbi:lmo0937 family membrane protein [Pedobacter alpinus]|uniref:Lmo0937 family membrane protein n=1 Tax=Pedobacter alpinus TaxID=1590643 RepID=A0ABW5TT36_9SPHI